MSDANDTPQHIRQLQEDWEQAFARREKAAEAMAEIPRGDEHLEARIAARGIWLEASEAERSAHAEMNTAWSTHYSK